VKRLTVLLRAYRIVSAVCAPLTPLLLARRLKRGKEDGGRLPERRGWAGYERPGGPLIWLHAASVGELASVLPLIDTISRRGFAMLVTTGTVTSSGLAEQRLPRNVVHQFVPLDVPRFMRRFLDHWRPDLALYVESDLWPNMMTETSARAIPMLLLNGRLSERSYRRWRFLPSSIASLLGRFDLCLARTPADAARLTELGAPRVAITGDLKFDVPAPPADPVKLQALRGAIGSRSVIAAASTHEGEESIVVDVHRRLRAQVPGLLTIIAPRHPERGPGIAGLATAAGLKTALRTRNEIPDAATEIYVADTMGELGLIYRLAAAVFIGGSLVEHGGQNPIEAAKLGAPILHGPHVWNFAETYEALDGAHGAEAVADAGRLTAALAAMLAQPELRAKTAKAAHATVDAQSGALQRTLNALDPYLMQLQLRSRAAHA
jgi:3-deoxy-D-manno-octulosonic-acid transferase